MENENLKIYEKVRAVPDKAQKKITGGKLNGMTDINPMWRIKTLTEQFGPCGIGWYTVEKRKWLEQGADGEVVAFVDIDLFVKIDGAWSAAIPGTGGSKFVAKEKGGLYTDDEAYKKAYTDAISVACKALGIGADVYWEKDASKYDPRGNGDDNGAPAPQTTGQERQGTPQTGAGEPLPQSRTSKVQALIKGTPYSMIDVIRLIDQKFPGGKGIEGITEEQFDTVMKIIGRKVGKAAPDPMQNRKEKSKYAKILDLINGSSITLKTVTQWIFDEFGKNILINDLTDEQFLLITKEIKGELGIYE